MGINDANILNSVICFNQKCFFIVKKVHLQEYYYICAHLKIKRHYYNVNISKYQTTHLSAVLLFLMCSLLLASCSNKEDKTYVVGVSQPCDDAWRQRMNEEMRRELLFHQNITLEFRNSEYDNEKQCADVDYFIGKGVDLLIVCPNEAEPLTPAVTKAYKQGIPVIVADRKVIGSDYTAAISGDNNQVGELLGNYVVEALKDGGKVVEFLGLPNASPTITRHEPLQKSSMLPKTSSLWHRFMPTGSGTRQSRSWIRFSRQA